MSMPYRTEAPALIVDDVTKTFHRDQPSMWQRLLKGKNAVSKTRLNSDGTVKKPVVAVDHVSFEIQRGEIFGVLGPNGSGKSTLIRVISTLLTADSGVVTVFGKDIRAHEMEVKRMINRVSVDAAFFKKLSPMENLLYGARLYGVSGRVAETKAKDILKRLNLDPSTYYEPMEEMSRGMQQKVAIARAFLTSPILLLLDEPTTGLDPRSKLEVRAFIQELCDVHDATILITTHDMEEADALCNRVAIIHDGKMVALDTPAALKSTLPRNGHEPTLEEVFMAMTGEVLVKHDEVEPVLEEA
jgi:ABC-2 type transport system ATP-binding protein